MATEDLTFRFNVTGNAVPELQKVQRQVRAVDDQIKRSNAALRRHSGQYNSAAVAANKFAKGALQQAGYQVGDFVVQVTNGTSAMQAFGQQGAQLAGVFGPIGAVVGAGIAIFSAIAVAAERSGKQINDVGAAFGVLQEPIAAVANSVQSLGGVFNGVFPVILQNIDTALIAATLFAGYMGVKYVVSMAAATAATVTFTGAMYRLGVVTGTVQKILQRFLPAALLLGLAKIIEMFLTLVKGAAGFGIALGLLKDVALEVVDRIVLAFKSIPLAVKAGAALMSQFFLERLANMSEAFVDFTADVADAFNALFNTNLTPLGQSMATGMRAAADAGKAAAAEATAEFSAMAGSITAPLQSLEALTNAYKNGREDVVLFGDAAEEANDKAASSGANAAEAIKQKMTEAQERLKSLAESISGSFGNALMSVVDGTKSVGEAFRSMAVEIIKELYRVFVVKQITGFIERSITSLFGAPTAAPVASLRPVARPSSFAGGGYTGNGARAGGLDGKGGFMAMMHPRESVIDHTRGQGAGGVIVNQTINVSTGVSQTVRSEIRSLMPQIAENAKNAVVDAKRRGGSYGRAFA
jgi:hypothetical protein